MNIGSQLATGLAAAYIRVPDLLRNQTPSPSDFSLGMGEIVAIAGTVIAASIALILFLLRQSAELRSRKRNTCAKALADALAWLELPYRVRRKVADASLREMANLADRAHQLQEAHLLHESWLRIEVPDVYEAYVALLGAVRTAASQPLKAAWEHEPNRDGKDMNIGGLDVPRVDGEVKAYTDAVQNALSAKFLGIY